MQLFTTPERIELKNSRSALMNKRFVDQEIEKLLYKGCIQEVKDKPKVVNP